MRRLFLVVGIAGLIGLALPAPPGAGASTAETAGLPTEVVKQLTGDDPDSINDTDGMGNVYGTDLGHMFLYGDQLRFTFGDTFGPGGPEVGPGGTDHRDNTMAWGLAAGPAGEDGLRLDEYVTDAPGHAKKLFDDDTVASVIPTYGIAVGERMFLHYMAVRQWLSPGRWDVAYSGIAYSDDRGQTWVRDDDARWGDRSNFAQVAFLRGSSGPLALGDTPYVYLFGIKEGRFGGVKLARVPDTKDALLEPSAYSYWTGSRWVNDEKRAIKIVPAPVGELSVRWNGHYQTWFMTYLNDNNLPGEAERIVLRYSERLTGPWSDELLLTTSAEYRDPYAPYQVPNQPDGAHLYYNMSRFDEYNVFLMRTTLPASLPSSDGPQLAGLLGRTLRRLLP